jgi:two-component system, OmpR family, response regulator RegX3
MGTTTDRLPLAAPDGPHEGPSGFPAPVAYDHRVALPGRRRILLIEDEESITEPLADALAREGFEALVASSAAEGLELGNTAGPDLILLDLMLPDGSGLDICRELRKTSEVPIVMLTARGDEADRIVGLELGADDYVTKPFSAREVVARIRAVLRRAGGGQREDASGPIEIGQARLDPERRELELAGEGVELSRKEYDLLYRLMRDAGSVITREQLIEDVWDMNWFGSTKTLDVHVSGLRRKLGDDPANPRYLHTVRGVGFRFSAASEADQ